MSTTMPYNAGLSLGQGRQRWYLAAFAAFCSTVYAMAAMSPEGLAETAIFLAAAQMAALMAGLAVYAGATEVADAPVAEASPAPKAGKEALRASLADLLRLAERSVGDLAVAVMLIEPDQGHPAGHRSGHAFERMKLALKSRAGRAEAIELSESCVAVTLASYSASYELEQMAHGLLRDLREFRLNESGMAPLNLTFGIGVCSGERSSVESLLWQARVALRRAYDLNTEVYVVSNRSNLAGRL